MAQKDRQGGTRSAKRRAASLGQDEDPAAIPTGDLTTQAEKLGHLISDQPFDKAEEQAQFLQRLQQIRVKGKGQSPEELEKAKAEFIEIESQVQTKMRLAKEQRTIRFVVPGLIAFYLIALVAVILIGGHQQWTRDTAIPIIGLPLAVMLWSSIGSIAAILYRFYTSELGRLADEVRWLIARPIIGIIMGALAYMTIISGLILFGVSDQAELARPEVLWVVAFLGGFSDKFFEGIIGIVINKVSSPPGKQSGDTPTSSKRSAENADGGG